MAHTRFFVLISDRGRRQRTCATRAHSVAPAFNHPEPANPPCLLLRFPAQVYSLVEKAQEWLLERNVPETDMHTAMLQRMQAAADAAGGAGDADEAEGEALFTRHVPRRFHHCDAPVAAGWRQASLFTEMHSSVNRF